MFKRLTSTALVFGMAALAPPAQPRKPVARVTNLSRN